MIETKNLCKSYRKSEALIDASLRFEENKIYGLLGRNGAGKTTLLNCIDGRIFSSSGEILMDGEPIPENDKKLNDIYLMTEQMLYPENMKIKNIFKWSANFYPDFDIPYAMRISEKFGLDVNKKSKALSTGYSSILKCVISLSVNTKYVFFDEPVLGLDANHRDLFYRLLIEKFSEEPFTAVVSTHLIDEVASIIEDVIIIEQGRVLRQDSCEQLLKNGYTISGRAADVDSFIIGKQILSADSIGGLKTVCVMEPLDRSKVPPELDVTKLDLQKLFIQMTNAAEDESKAL